MVGCSRTVFATLSLLAYAVGQRCGTQIRNINNIHPLLKNNCKTIKKVCLDQGVLRFHSEDQIRGDVLVKNISAEEKHEFRDYIHHASLVQGKELCKSTSEKSMYASCSRNQVF